MEKLKVFFRENGLSNVDVVVFSTEALCNAYIFKINKDFKIDSTEKHIFGYYVDLNDNKILNLKQFKMDISK